MALKNINDIYRGDTRTFKVSFTDSSGLPIPLYGKTLWFTLKSSEDDTDINAVLVVKHDFPDDEYSSAGSGSITLTSTDTNVPVNEYFYDFQLTVPGSPPIVTTLAKGTIQILQDITQTDT